MKPKIFIEPVTRERKFPVFELPIKFIKKTVLFKKPYDRQPAVTGYVKSKRGNKDFPIFAIGDIIGPPYKGFYLHTEKYNPKDFEFVFCVFQSKNEDVENIIFS